MRLTELQVFLDARGIRPNRQLGQCFLVDDNVARWIVDRIDPQPGDTVVEVGPGAGALTRHLAGRVKRLILIEKDAKLAAHLVGIYAGRADVEVIHGDAVEFDCRPLFPGGPVKFIGNLPYSVGNEILRVFLTPPTPVAAAVAMVQREVADRLCAKPRTKDYGILSLMIQERWRTECAKTVGPQLFFPRPEVDSSIVRFSPREPRETATHCPQTFASIVRRGFSQRRKQLRNNLGAEPIAWEAATSTLGIPITVRAEELDLGQWIALSNLLELHPAGRHAQSGAEIFDVVDENDRVTGQATRAEVHARGLRHRAVHVLVFNPAGEVYLQKRSYLKDTHAGAWDSSSSGHLDAGEDYATAAARELEEELLLRPARPPERLGKIPAGPGTDMEFVEIFRSQSDGQEIRIHGNEIDSGGYFPVSLVRNWIAARPGDFATGFRTVFGYLLETGALGEIGET